MKKKELIINHDDFLSLSTEITQRGMSFIFVARGGSMSPFIKDGDMVLIEPFKGSPETGEILLIRTPEGRALLHRVISVEKDGVTTRGDATCQPDGTFGVESIVGRAVRVEGRGYNFHLKRPFSYLIAKRIFYSPLLSKVPGVKGVLKAIARLLG